ncbi:MAG: hypothetical protein KDA65_14405 [Planctomycetaceae bacterium]|nr:hypothetical protein [Planctomycetaceae bacterium]
MSGKKLHCCDIYRDGGSYGFSFVDEVGNEFELVTEVIHPKDGSWPPHQFEQPVLYAENWSHGERLRSLTWEEAIDLVNDVEVDFEVVDKLIVHPLLNSKEEFSAYVKRREEMLRLFESKGKR